MIDFLINKDKKLFLFFFSLPSLKYLRFLSWFATFYSIATNIFFNLIFALLIFIKYRNNTLTINFVLVPFLTYILLKFLRLIIKRKRPFLIFPNLNIPTSNKYSLPSNHVGASFILSFTFFTFNTTLGIFSIVISIILSFMRIIQGVHFPVDTFVGFFISTLIAHIFYFT